MSDRKDEYDRYRRDAIVFTAVLAEGYAGKCKLDTAFTGQG
jgi:hypothetical protein